MNFFKHRLFVLVLTLLAVASACGGNTDQVAADESPDAVTTTTAAADTTVPSEPEPIDAIDVVLLDDPNAIRLEDRIYDDLSETPDWVLGEEGDLFTLTYRGSCGDECGRSIELALRNADGEPEFVSYTSSQSEGDGGGTGYTETIRELDVGRIELTTWDPENQVLAGRVFFAGEERPDFVFYFDRNDDTVLARAERGVQVAVAEIEEAIASEDAAVVSNAMEALARGHLEWDPSFQAELLELLDGGPDREIGVSFRAATGLYDLFGELFVGGERPLSPFVPADPANDAQLSVVRANFTTLFSARERVGPEAERTGPGSFSSAEATSASCPGDVWDAPCGITINLFCSGLAFWNEGNDIVASTWTSNGDLVVFDDRQPDMSAIGGEVDAATWINEGQFRSGGPAFCPDGT